MRLKAMKDIIEGERLDMTLEQAGREDPYLKTQRVLSPNFALYLEMIGKKTAALFKAARLSNPLLSRSATSVAMSASG